MSIYSQLPITDQPEISTEKDTILLVEDNPSLQQFIQSILAPHYNVIVTGNGIEALEQLAVGSKQLAENGGALPTASEATANCQLILSDVMMPEMDGFTLLEKVKADDKLCSIPFILLTARADIEDKLHGLRIGVDDYMTKPFEVEELLLRIKNLITNSKNRSVELETEDEEVQKVKVKTVQKETAEQKEITSTDLEWLKQVEIISKREIRNKQYNLDQLAHEVHTSKRQLARKIKQITGLTPSAYIRSIRLQEARRVFETQNTYTISEVSIHVGFENVSHFTKLYQKEFGKHPREYLDK